MCIKCIITPIVFLIIVVIALFLIWGDVFAASALDNIGTHNPEVFTSALAERTSGQKMLGAFVALVGFISLGGLGFFIKTKLKPSASTKGF